MPEIIDCSHCLYFHTYSYYDEDFNEYWLSECKFDNLSFDQYICSSFKATEITKKIFLKGAISMSLNEWIDKTNIAFRYKLLSRMQQDCEYYLGNGNKNPNNLWGITVDNHIDSMKYIWNSFSEDEKPEWLTMEQINEYALKMTKKEIMQ